MNQLRLKLLLRVYASTMIGLLVGVAALYILRSSVPGVSPLFYFLSYPGIRVGRLWTDSGLPPYGEAAFGIIALGIIIQWTVLGFFTGVCWKR